MSSRKFSWLRMGLLVGLLAMLAGSSALASRPAVNLQSIEGPVANAVPVQDAATLPVLSAEPVDVAAARAEDSDREAMGLPPRFALPSSVSVSPENSGLWEDLDGPFAMWRYRVQAPGAMSLNFGFSSFRMPKYGRLTIYPAGARSAADARGVRVFTDRDNEDHGQLWTPVVLGDDVVIELVLPDEARHDYALELTAVNRGYRYFGEDLSDKSGSCNVDVICPEGDDWRDEIPSVGVISTGGSTFCTGFLVNNTAGDGTPFFMTANHCGINTGNAASLVVYWNFQSPVCGQQGGGSLSQFSTGSTYLAGNSTSDFTLVELDDPLNPAYELSLAGWDNTSADPVQAVAIHHPNTDEKSISFEIDPTSTTSYLGNTVPGDGTHVRITDWDLGTTEPGSSGSPLFDQNHHIVGQLHGGYAACGNNSSDWYGRFSRSWPFLAAYLDPSGTGATSLDTFVPGRTGLVVTPPGAFTVTGDEGGPFTPSQRIYNLENKSDVELSYQVTVDVPWLDVNGGAGTIPAAGSVPVMIAVNDAAGALSLGRYVGTVTFLNLTDGDGDTTRPVNLQVGIPELVYGFNMDTDPGWTMDTGWEYGIPQGLGGEHGNPDPTSGHTGANVIGFNLAGDYIANMGRYNMVSGPFDCSRLSAVTVKFWRWLGVENSSYDHAAFAVSNDGVNYSIVWQNTATVEDAAWTQVAYDISAEADGQGSVYLAWAIGPTDGSYQYCGWNIDDLEIWGLNGGGSGLDLAMTPLNPPVQIPPAGGQFVYQVGLAVDHPVTVSAAFEAVLPNGVVYPVRTTPVLNLAAGNYVWLNLIQNVPANAPAGIYSYRLTISTADGEAAQAMFPFEKSAVAKSGGRVDDWELSGWEDGDRPSDLPAGFALRGASPNPFNPLTNISFDLPRAAKVYLDVFDVAGRRVRTLVGGQTMPAGQRSVIWDGQDDTGRGAATGVYFYRLQAGEFTGTGRMMLVK